MIKICIIGGGNVAYHLTNKLLNSKGISILQVYNRTLSKIEHLIGKVAITDSLENLKEADVYIITTSDEVISSISSKINFKNKLIVHISGGASINELQTENRKGVLYFLQSFSKNKIPEFSSIPVCIEAENDEDYQLLNKIALSISEKIYHINSADRLQLHVAAVFVNNFVNHLYKIGYDICKEHNVPFEILKPIIVETASKISDLIPFEAQTGPAKRKDQNTIEKHLNLLHNNQKEIYTLLSNSISKTYE